MNTQPEQTNKIGLELADEIGLITEQAKGVLLLLSINMDADNKANDDIAKAAVDSAIASIERIDGIIRDAERIVGKDAMAGAGPTTKPTQSGPSLDSLFESAQRAHAVISMAINGFHNAEDDDIVYSLYAAQREVTEVKEGLEAVLFDDLTEVQGGAA